MKLSTEKIGDRVIYTYEIAVEGNDFYFDNRVLSNIETALKYALKNK